MAKVDFVSLNVYFKIKDPKDAKDDLYASVSVSDVKNIGELTGAQIADDILRVVQDFAESVGVSMEDIDIVFVQGLLQRLNNYASSKRRFSRCYTYYRSF